MKTLKDLFEIASEAVSQNREETRTWFIDFSGHVNKMKVVYYRCGWSADAIGEEVSVYLTETGIQALYWFIANKL